VVTGAFFPQDLAKSKCPNLGPFLNELTLKEVDRASSPGTSGLDFALLRHVDAGILAPLLEPYFGHEQ
jgi:hypothetical protein